MFSVKYFLRIICLCFSPHLICCENDQLRLQTFLLNKSQEYLHIIPVAEENQTMSVKLGMALLQINDLNVQKQVLDLLVWFRFIWSDQTLQWNPSEFGNIDHVRIPPKKFWKPDIVLFNGAWDTLQPDGLGLVMVPFAVASSDGSLLWIPQARTKSTCVADVTLFPFDEQECVLKLGSWTYDGVHLDLDFFDDLAEIDLNDYTESEQWHIIDHPAKKNVKYYPCCQEPYTDITFKLKLKRKFWSGCLLIAPGFLLLFLVPMIFLIHVGRTEKFILGGTLLVSLTLLTIHMDTAVPASHSTVPVIEKFYLFNMLFTGLSLFASIIVLNVSRLQSEPPHCLRKMIGCLGKMFCVIPYNSSSGSLQVRGSNKSDTLPHPDWVVLATVLDRFFLICSCILLVVPALVMFL